MASLADVSKYGILPFDWHQVIARFWVTYGQNFEKKLEDTRQHGPDVCLPQRLSYFLTPQKGNSPDHEDSPG